MKLALKMDRERHRNALELEMAVLRSQILDMERAMDTMYTSILRQRKQVYDKGAVDQDLLTASENSDRLIARYYALAEQIRELDSLSGPDSSQQAEQPARISDRSA